MSTITIELSKLINLLNQQKDLVAEKLLSETYVYNTESTDSHTKSIQNIDKEKFKRVAVSAKLPRDIETLKEYIL